jgi:hypothetical protein
MESSQLAANTRIALNARYVWPGARSRGARSLAWNASAVGFVDAIARSMQAKKAASREIELPLTGCAAALTAAATSSVARRLMKLAFALGLLALTTVAANASWQLRPGVPMGPPYPTTS